MTALVAHELSLPGRLAPTDLAIPSGQMIALIGPNGGGKTSLLRALARVEDAAGSVAIDGASLDDLGAARRRRLLSFLPASREVGWPIPVADVIALGLGRHDPARIGVLIDQFELADLASRPVDRLSTGERTRVLLARAMAAEPRVLLLDEPFANLEPYWVLRLSEIMRRVADEGRVVIVALHDLHRIDRYDRALLVAGGHVEMDEAPANLMASERFESIFRVTAGSDGWAIRPADRQSLR